jgi:DNA-binding GntR family transcriptional regulator
VQRDTLGSQIAHLIRQDILFGRLQAGKRLTQDQLCEVFGTSRMPVRDALRQLTSEGLLVRDGGQNTALVAQVRRNDIEDAFLLEGLVHGEAARRVATQGATPGLDVMVDLHAEMLAAAERGNPAPIADLNWQFHRQLNRMANSRKIIAALKVVSLHVPRDFLSQFPGKIGESNAQHAVVIDAIRKRDPYRAQAVMFEHVVDAGRTLVSYLEEQGLELD